MDIVHVLVDWQAARRKKTWTLFARVIIAMKMLMSSVRVIVRYMFQKK